MDYSEPIELEILNTGSGHLRITFDPGEPSEVQKAKDTISLLLRRGFALFIQERGRTVRVRDFDPERGSYYVDDVPDEARQHKAEADATPGGRVRGGRRGRRGRRQRTVPARGHRVTAVGRTAGG